MRGGRKNLHVRLSPEAFDAIGRYAEMHDVNVNDLVEAWGLALVELPSPVTERGEWMIRKAREIKAARKPGRRRGGGG